MASLTGQSVASTYPLLVKLPTSGLTSAYKTTEDGLGTASALALSTLGVKSNGLLESAGNAVVGGTLTVTGATALNSTLTVTGATTELSTLSVSGALTATGGLVGNVTGNLTGNVTGNTAGTHTGSVVGNVTGNVSGSSATCTGNAATATTLQTPRTIQLTGVILGSASFDGSANISIATTTAGTAVPAGIIVPFAGTSVPTFWMECNGSAISRTTFAALFAAIGETYGAGNGTTTFNIPDLRGEFMRGWDNGRGVDSGRIIGSNQSAGVGSFSSTLNGTMISWDQGSSPAANSTNATIGANASGGNANVTTSSLNLSGGSETRPRNVAIMYIIKL